MRTPFLILIRMAESADLPCGQHADMPAASLLSDVWARRAEYGGLYAGAHGDTAQNVLQHLGTTWFLPGFARCDAGIQPASECRRCYY